MFSKTITRANLALFFAGIAAVVFVGCGGNTGSEVRLQGAGATFPNPLYQKWLSEYGKLNAKVKINYQSYGEWHAQAWAATLVLMTLSESVTT